MALAFNEEVRLLSMVDVLEPLSAEEIEELARRHSDTPLEQGEVFFAPQERGEKLFILEEGRVRIYRNRTSPQGQETTLAVAEEGTIFGEMALTAQRLREKHRKSPGALYRRLPETGGPGGAYLEQPRSGSAAGALAE